ncbi:alpha/beta hydrolase domain-containing protein [Streptomyces sp. NPDC020747]|uniref:alpha/beta hydrolase domain-containing protein n=1 Tax=Streptomyces sp. NPDC020747 TaxID=3365086 RepID=UPI0037B6EA19
MDTVTPAVLRQSPDDGSAAFAPYGTHVPSLDTYDYVEEEWIATGEEDGHSYATTVLVRRPRDWARFSGTVIAEPLHVHGIAPIWIYTGPYILRSGHAWVEITAQKTTLDLHVKASNAQRYESLHIEGPDSADFDMNANLGNREASKFFFSELRRRNRAASTILAQVGAALRSPEGPFADTEVGQVVLAGHSQTGWVTTTYVDSAHDVQRLAGGAPVYDGFFPSGFPLAPFHDVDVPVVQVMSDGDVSVPTYSFVPGHEGRQYRRDDSDKPGDRFRLYELAGIPHMGTRQAPYNDVSLWKATFPDDDVTFGPKMNSLPHFELFNMGLHHLVEWVANGTVPPRADRLEVGEDGYFALDEHGNTKGGVRSVQLDVPHSAYRANPTNPDGTPSYLTIGSEKPFDPPKLRELYGSSSTYVERFDSRLDELVAGGWLLAEDADDMRSEARQIEIP